MDKVREAFICCYCDVGFWPSCPSCGREQPNDDAKYINPLFKTNVINNPLPLEPTKQDNWSPIETAPKDGTEMLVINKHWWTPVNGNNRWIYSKIKQASWNGHQFNNDGLQPTHWQPLPNPPEKIGE